MIHGLGLVWRGRAWLGKDLFHKEQLNVIEIDS